MKRNGSDASRAETAALAMAEKLGTSGFVAEELACEAGVSEQVARRTLHELWKARKVDRRFEYAAGDAPVGRYRHFPVGAVPAAAVRGAR